MASMTIELSEYVIDAIADAVVKKMQKTTTETFDKIRAEIVALKGAGYYKAVSDALEIIDKYRTESEGKGMTREEAIARLKEIDIRDALQEDYDALYVAIEALEQEPCDYYDADNKTCRRSEVPKEPCEDAISRQALLEKIYNIDGFEGLENSNIFAKHYADMVKSMPSVQPKQKIGHWVFKNDNIAIPTGYFQCSWCNGGALLHKSNFCPNCGARMIEPQEESEVKERTETHENTRVCSDVLDKIRDEIEQMNCIDYVKPVTVDEVLQIIDKYRTESEG